MAKILVAEDERDIRDIIAFTMRFAGHEVWTATNGEEVIQIGTEVRPDLFLLDVRMPRMTGYEACRVLKTSSVLKDIPVVFLSAKGQEAEIQTGLEAGAEDYLLKPFAPDQLTARIGSILAKFEKQIKPEPSMEKDDKQEDSNSLMKEFWKSEAERLYNEKEDLLRRLSQGQEQSRQTSRPDNPKSAFLALFSAFFHRPGKVQTSNQQFPLGELSRITSGIVHDIRNGLGAIRSTIDFMPADPSISSDLERILNNVEYCDRILSNLSGLSGQVALHPEQVDLEEIISKTYFMLKNKLVDVELVMDSDNKRPVIQADKGQMEQVFMNLIINAGEAMPDGGPLTCRFRQEGDMMCIEIQDSGCGITKENQKRLFREFFTTKGRGSGIGLYNVHNIIEHHGGKISVESKEGKGTTFSIRLPITGKSS